MEKYICIVCGMEISEKNYNINKEALIHKNTVEVITNCPFCGVNREFLKKDEEPYDFKELKFNEKELKIIDHAVKLEVFNGDFYKIATNMAKDSEVKALFSALSRIEYCHARIHSNIGGFKALPSLTKLDYSKYDSDEKLLNLAVLREKHAIEYYSKYSKEINNELVKKIFKALSDVEVEHIYLTENK